MAYLAVLTEICGLHTVSKTKSNDWKTCYYASTHEGTPPSFRIPSQLCTIVCTSRKWYFHHSCRHRANLLNHSLLYVRVSDVQTPRMTAMYRFRLQSRRDGFKCLSWYRPWACRSQFPRNEHGDSGCDVTYILGIRNKLCFPSLSSSIYDCSYRNLFPVTTYMGGCYVYCVLINVLNHLHWCEEGYILT